MPSPSITSPASQRPIRRRRWTGQPGLKRGLLLGLALLGAAAVPLLTDLTWADFAEEASDQALAALQLVQAAFTILTL
jgi:hypothetical protein